MKKFTLIVFALLCFGISKAHFLPKNFKTLKPQIEIRGINALPDYNVTFKVYKAPLKRWIKKNKIEIVNTIAIQAEPTKIIAVSASALRRHSSAISLKFRK